MNCSAAEMLVRCDRSAPGGSTTAGKKGRNKAARTPHCSNSSCRRASGKKSRGKQTSALDALYEAINCHAEAKDVKSLRRNIGKQRRKAMRALENDTKEFWSTMAQLLHDDGAPITACERASVMFALVIASVGALTGLLYSIG